MAHFVLEIICVLVFTHGVKILLENLKYLFEEEDFKHTGLDTLVLLELSSYFGL